MKKTLIALAAVAATGAAFAQSSVTLFGVVDLNVRSVKQGGESLTSMSQDGIASSRLGFRGVEDLGGGMKAGFWLEAGLNPDTGTPNGLQFQRRSTVSLMGNFGEVRLGRDYTPTFWNHTVYDPFGTNGVGSSVNTLSVLGSGATTLVRANNSIGYFLPNFGGFSGQFMYALKEAKTANTPNEYTGIRLTYAAGPLSVALATATEGSSVETDSFKRTNVGASYDFGVAKPMAQYTIGKFGAREVKHLMVGVVAPVGPGNIKASYTRSDYNPAAGNGDANQIAVGYDYNLSKRTAVYGTYSRLTNKNGGSSFGLAPNAAAQTANGKSTGIEFGVRHTF
ncbi:porin [Hydrogenophaga sp.]|uniref:porin n=1 Tax=Hydrogenophaga sp. TaxID=1904254 RepID=UPI002727C5DD|nr:porin [Hydrogenophaga sp.]MDO8905457.1 porin [Hydrogenophaga sp.]